MKANLKSFMKDIFTVTQVFAMASVSSVFHCRDNKHAPNRAEEGMKYTREIVG